jgi:hypothetical protein
MKRARPTPVTPDTFSFSLSNGHAFRAERLASGEASADNFDETDNMSFVIHFRPALSEAQAAAAELRATYVGDKEVAGGPLVFARAVRPADAPCIWLTLRPGELEYLCFETHQLRAGQVAGTFSALYVTLENTQCEQGPLHLGPQLDMHLFCMPQLLPGSTFLRWFPPDVDPKQWGLQIDARKIPQRTPLWFKMRAEVSGTVAVKRTGFFANEQKMTSFNRSAMRLGSQSEDLILLSLLEKCYEHRHFSEIGTCAVAGRPGWGASPDGMLCDDTMTWAALPPGSVGHAETGVAWDVKLGACEFKTSRTKLVMEPYFYPQLYMEMMALGVLWAELVRYRPSRTWANGEWEYQDVCHVYRVYRETELEAKFVRTWADSDPNHNAEAKAELRAELTRLAEDARPVAVIDATGSPMLARYRAHRAQLLRQQAVHPTATPPPDWWLAIETRTAQLAAQLKNGVAIDKRVVAAQIKAYANLL